MSEPYYIRRGVTVHGGDCLDHLRTMPAASVDAVVTDPPYGLANHRPDVVTAALVAWAQGDRERVPDGRGFMGRDWDTFVPPPAVWDECLRVLRPGGHLVAFAGSRTYDLMGLSIRLAGFEVRDGLQWLYGSGFPKSLDVGKAIDKARDEDVEPAAAVARWLCGQLEARDVTRRAVSEHFGAANIAQQWTTYRTTGVVKPRVPSVKQWAELRRWLDLPADMDAEVRRLNERKGRPGDDFQFEEKPAAGVGFMRPDGRSGYNVTQHRLERVGDATPAAEQWQGWGTALKPAHEPIVLARKPLAGTVAANVLAHGTGALNIDGCRVGGAAGRWPSNVLLGHGEGCADECAPGCPVAELDAQSGAVGAAAPVRGTERSAAVEPGTITGARARVPGAFHADSGGASRFFPSFRYQAKAPARERPKIDGQAHPTVKPLALMAWLVRLVTPPGGTVLDPFAGSGTTLQAARDEGFRCIGVEREPAYLPLILARLDGPSSTQASSGDPQELLDLFDLLAEESA